jgi:hypothetical protein
MRDLVRLELGTGIVGRADRAPGALLDQEASGGYSREANS